MKAQKTINTKMNFNKNNNTTCNSCKNQSSRTWSTVWISKQSNIGTEWNHQKPRGDIIEWAGHILAQERSKTWQLWRHGFRIKDTRKRLWNLRLQLRKVTEVRYVTEMSLCGDPERSLCEVVKVKPGFHWRIQCWRSQSHWIPAEKDL